MEKYSSCRGIGFQFETAPEYTLRVSGIDLYHVIREDGTIEPFAASIVELMNFYLLHGAIFQRYWPAYSVFYANGEHWQE